MTQTFLHLIKLIFLTTQTPFIGVFCIKYSSFASMEKEHLIFGIVAIIEAIQSGAAVDKVFIQKEISGE